MKRTARIEVVDALRGFAILCILLLHASNHFLYDEIPENQSALMKSMDTYTKQILYFLFEGKAFGIFALLFGFTFGIQHFKAQENGKDFRFRFLWRMVLLSGFGYFNAAFFAGGDPLVFMAVVAVVLPMLAKFNTRILIIIAVLLLLQPLEIYKAVYVWLDPGYRFQHSTGQLYALLKPAVSDGNFFAMALNNVTTGLKACLTWAFEYGRFSQTAGLYVLGFLSYKHGLFTNLKHHFWEKLCIVTLIVAPVFYLLKSIAGENLSHSEPLQIATTMWYNLSFLFLIVGFFVLLFRTELFKKVTAAFQVYGKMSLTNFIFQSIIGSFLFYPYGMHLASYCGIFVSVLIGIAIASVQIYFSYWWLGKFRQGPLEYLWHKATYCRP